MQLLSKVSGLETTVSVRKAFLRNYVKKKKSWKSKYTYIALAIISCFVLVIYLAIAFD